MNKKCIYYDTCWESHTECLYGKECDDYEPIAERRKNKAEREHLKRCIVCLNQMKLRKYNEKISGERSS